MDQSRVQRQLDELQRTLSSSIADAIERERYLETPPRRRFAARELSVTPERVDHLARDLASIIGNPSLVSEPSLRTAADALARLPGPEEQQLRKLDGLVDRYLELLRDLVAQYRHTTHPHCDAWTATTYPVLQSALPAAAQARNRSSAREELLRLSGERLTEEDLPVRISALEGVRDTYLFAAYDTQRIRLGGYRRW